MLPVSEPLQNPSRRVQSCPHLQNPDPDHSSLQASPLGRHLQELLGLYYGPRSGVVIKIGPEILLSWGWLRFTWHRLAKSRAGCDAEQEISPTYQPETLQRPVSWFLW